MKVYKEEEEYSTATTTTTTTTTTTKDVGGDVKHIFSFTRSLFVFSNFQFVLRTVHYKFAT